MPEAKLIPATGRTVPLQDGQPWPRNAKGELQPQTLALTAYYRRRVKDADLVVADDAEAAGGAEPEGDGAKGAPPADPPSGSDSPDETKTKGGRSGARKES